MSATHRILNAPRLLTEGGRRTMPRRHGKGDRATAILEFALIAPLFALFVFGIIIFGLLLGFRQNVTQAVNEGARAGAVVQPQPGLDQNGANNAARAAAEAARDSALDAFDERSCDDEGMECIVGVDTCVKGDTDGPWCIKVLIEYDYENYPFLPDVPLLAAALPDTIRKVSVAQINPGFTFPADPNDPGTGGDGHPDCHQIFDEGCQPLCNDIPNDGVADCLANPLDECDFDPATDLPDCGPLDSCDSTAGNLVPDCPADEGEQCDDTPDNATEDCDPVPPCDLEPGGTRPDCPAQEGESCNLSDTNDGIPTCTATCDDVPGGDLPDCLAAEGETCNSSDLNDGIPTCVEES